MSADKDKQFRSALDLSLHQLKEFNLSLNKVGATIREFSDSLNSADVFRNKYFASGSRSDYIILDDTIDYRKAGKTTVFFKISKKHKRRINRQRRKLAREIVNCGFDKKTATKYAKQKFNPKNKIDLHYGYGFRLFDKNIKSQLNKASLIADK